MSHSFDDIHIDITVTQDDVKADFPIRLHSKKIVFKLFQASCSDSSYTRG